MDPNMIALSQDDPSNPIETGIAYLELKGFSTKKQNSEVELVSKNGAPMLLLWWSATDRFGNTETVYDYISSASNVKFKRDNLENALGLPKGSSIWKEEEGRFQIFMLHNRVFCCGAIKKEFYNNKMSPKIARYLPLEFLRVAYEGKDKREQSAPVAHENSVSQVSTVSVSNEEDFDGIPF